MKYLLALILVFVSHFTYAQTTVQISGSGNVFSVNPSNAGLYSIGDSFTAHFYYNIPLGFGGNHLTEVAARIEVNGHIFEMIVPLETSLQPTNTDNALYSASTAFWLRAISSTANTYYSGPVGTPTPDQLTIIIEGPSLYNTPSYPQSNIDLNLPTPVLKAEIIDNTGISRFDFDPATFSISTATSFPTPPAPSSANAVPSSTPWSILLSIVGISVIGRRKLKYFLS